MRQRRHATQSSAQQPAKLNQPVMMAAYAQSSDFWRNWVGRHLTVRTALRMVAAKEAEAITRMTPNGLVTIYRETQPSRAHQPSPSSLTVATSHALARRGERLTAAEQAHVNKFLLWPTIGDNKAPLVQPRMSEQHQREAERILGVNEKRLAAEAQAQAHSRRVQSWRAPEMAAAST